MRRRWLILAVIGGVVGAAVVYTLRQPRIYEASTSLIIDASAPQYLDNAVKDVVESGTSSYWFNKEYYETQYKVIASRSVAQRVVDKLGLAQDPAFLGLEGIKDPAARQKAMAKADAVALLQSKIQVKPVKDSRVLYIVVEDTDYKRAALLANEVAEAYIAENLALKLRVSENASRWLEERLSTLEKESKASELALYEFKKQSDMLTTSLEDRQSMVSQRLTTINAARTEVETKIAALQARVEIIEKVRSNAASDSPDAHWAEGLFDEKDTLIEAQKIRFAQVREECAELGERYLEDHPKLKACKEKLQLAREALFRELDNRVALARNELSEAIARQKNLNKMFEEAKAEAFEVNKKQIEFDRLKREADNNQRLYDLVLKRLKDIELASLLRTSNVRVLDTARPIASPVKPSLKTNLLLAFLFGVMSAVGLAFVLEFLDTRIATQEQVEEWLKTMFLGVIPSFARDGGSPQLAVHVAPKSAIAECCRAIRTNLLFMSPERPLKTILITSSSPQDGKTTVAANLAITMAESGHRVLLVDADMRRPRVHRVFNVPNGTGLSTLILGQGTLQDAVKTTEVSNLFVLPCGPVPPNPAELLHTQAFRALLERITGQYDRVIIDSPPVGAVADAVVISTQVDGTLLVLKAGRTSRDMARRTLRALTDVKARVFGAVLNDLDLNDRNYQGYYYYYRRYGYYEDKEGTVS